MKNTEEKKTKQKNWFKECFLERRFFVLVLGALLGIALFLFVKEYDLLSKVFFYSQEMTGYIEMGRFITNLAPVILGLPIILFLWIFRTHDTKEQLDKAQTNIEQQDFHDALRMLADDKLVSQEIAVLRLIDISKKTKVYDDTIKLAFIKRMKAPYKEVDEALAKTKISKDKDKEETQETEALRLKIILKKIEYRTYAQYIFRWLGKRYARDELDLIRLDLRNQDFTAKKGEEIHYFKDKNNEPFILYQSQLAGVMFHGEGKINLSKVELRLSDLSGINFTKIDLADANLQNTILIEAGLTGVNLTGANLTGANLTGVDLRGADLTGADLRYVKGLTYEQLASVKSLDGAKGLETVLRAEELTRLKAEKPELFEPPKEEQNETKI